MRTSPQQSATVVVLNPDQIAQITRNTDVNNNNPRGLDLVNAGSIPDADLEALGLTGEETITGPANRPDPVDVISLGGRDLPVDRISPNAQHTPAYRGREFDLVA